ncbi:MAG: amidohydrolase [Hyphomicrobiaceae bacterium]|nr:amidohydrolase [Hyphomicrobiaceae bacterium]
MRQHIEIASIAAAKSPAFSDLESTACDVRGRAGCWRLRWARGASTDQLPQNMIGLRHLADGEQDVTQAMLLKGGMIITGAYDAPMPIGDLLLLGDRIAAVGPDLSGHAQARGARVLDCTDRLVIPGFVNAHTHSNESFEQGFYDALPLEVWLLWKYPPLAIPRLPERVHYLRTMLLGIECVRSGVTTIQDDLINQLADPAAFDGAAAAYRDLGVRANITTSMWDRPFLEPLLWTDELLDAEQREELGRMPVLGWREQIGNFERNAARWHGAGAGRLRVVPGPVGPQWCSTELLQAATDISRSRDLPVHTHTLESRLQAVQGSVMYGKTIIEHLHEIGALQPRFTLNHAIWLTDADIELMARAGCSMTHNPLSNLKLGSGIARVRDLLSAGVTVRLGTDGTSTSDRADMFRSLGMAALLHRVGDFDYERWTTAQDAFAMATTGSARAEGLEADIGVIAPGRKADLALIDATDYGLIPLKRPISQLCYAVNSDAVRTVIVDGEMVMHEHVLTKVDEPSLKAEIREEAERYARDHVPLMEQQAKRFESYFRHAHLRAAGVPVPAAASPVHLACRCAHPARDRR